MNSRRALALLLFVLAAYGAVIGYYSTFNLDPPRGLDFFFLPATVIPIYLWYRHDADERKYQRSALLGGSIIMFSLVAVPYYLVRSRPSGAKAKAVLRFVGFLLLSFAVMFAASLPFTFVSHGG
jgi:peptidoglycan/LPS O-acetylase OafA/YrhL